MKTYKCWHCNYTWYCYWVPTGEWVSAPFCKRCWMNNKLKKMIKCKTCWKMKYDTAFEMIGYEKNFHSLDTSKCLDCKYPKRWDEVKKYFKKILWNN